jgi:hypothetical protein
VINDLHVMLRVCSGVNHVDAANICGTRATCGGAVQGSCRVRTCRCGTLASRLTPHHGTNDRGGHRCIFPRCPSLDSRLPSTANAQKYWTMCRP